MIENITPRVCAATATTNTEEPRSLGTAPMINSTPMECARTVTSTATTRREGKNGQRKNMMMRAMKDRVN